MIRHLRSLSTALLGPTAGRSAHVIGRRWREADLPWLFFAVFVLFGILSATLEQRSDALVAWNSWLEICFGLLLPCLGYALSFSVSSRMTDPSHLDALSIRLGQSRRSIRARRLARGLVAGTVAAWLMLVVGRALCAPASTPYVNRDLVTCLGLAAFATITYISFFSAVVIVGLGSRVALIILLLELTLGHSDLFWAWGLPGPYFATLLGNSANSLVSPFVASWLLLAFIGVLWGLIAVRTPR